MPLIPPGAYPCSHTAIATPATMLASNDSLEISCTADARFRVLQVHAQHPADGRRDILVFNATLTDCYRAYQYLATGREEIFSSVC